MRESPQAGTDYAYIDDMADFERKPPGPHSHGRGGDTARLLPGLLQMPRDQERRHLQPPRSLATDKLRPPQSIAILPISIVALRRSRVIPRVPASSGPHGSIFVRGVIVSGLWDLPPKLPRHRARHSLACHSSSGRERPGIAQGWSAAETWGRVPPNPFGVSEGRSNRTRFHDLV